MNYQFFRLSLAEDHAPPLLEIGGVAKARLTRASFLVNLFSNDHFFQHRKKEFKYRFFGADGKILFGAIGKPSAAALRNDRFEQSDISGYKIGNVMLDTSGDSEGQKLVMQVNSAIGLPGPILSSFVDHLNQTSPRDQWRLSLFPMANENDFWEIEKKYRGEISRVQFKFAVPNMLGGVDAVRNELRSMGQEIRAQEVDLAVNRPKGGLSLVNNMIKSAWEYVRLGGGRAVIKVGKKTVYNSKKNVLSKSKDDDIDIATATEAEKRILAEDIFER